MLSSARQWWTLLARDADATQRQRARSPGLAASFDLEREGSPPVVLIIAGTRPECIKLAPLVRRLAGHDRLRIVLVNSGQHCLAVRRTFAEFDIRCNIELGELPRFDCLGASHDHLRVELRAVLDRIKPAMLVVQGDTLTAYSGARAAHDTSTMLAHIEAGLRTETVSDPFPEEWFRRRIARYASIHFAPSASAMRNLLAEGIDKATVHQVGNTGIDSLRTLLAEMRPAPQVTRAHETVLVTLHRRENHDRNAGIVCDGLIALTLARPDLRVLFPIHPNPRVSATVRRRLEVYPAFDLVAPMSYRDFVLNAATAALIISDSGGVQEEAPHLGTHLLVPRSNTERPEGIETGWVQLVRVDRTAILEAALEKLAAPAMRPVPFDEHAPFGDGNAADKIVQVVEQTLLQRAYA
ncbi:MAG TPA: UDP-N-acetylglucosamine 2-epimerase (non-hydrolyzing) [Casimicrobiaceae bacterium]|jgi:UDP-N-acetylglucosamine 2-epimerase (non-hydrolysing)|nr:UDP-N-acetylglucosamine 2-epimerase (non-hydrolyzing) [Casimicrobiaceae bacterium]